VAAATGSYFDALPTDDEVPDDSGVLPTEAEEHLQVVSDCLISLEATTTGRINKLFRAIHTVKVPRRSWPEETGAIAHRVEDLIGRLRDGRLNVPPWWIVPGVGDTLKKTLHRQWADEVEMRTGVDSLLAASRVCTA